MSLRRVVVLAASGVLVAGLATTAAGTALAQPSPNAAPNAQAMAASSASNLVASRPAALHASANDAFVQHPAISAKGGLQYVSYDRTYKGLPVVGGDFVVVTNSSGAVLSTSVAQDQTINLASTTPKLTAAQAEAVAAKQVSSVDGVGAARLVTYALGTPKLAWESTVTGKNAEGASKLTVEVDAATGKVLHTQEHVMHATGTGVTAYNGTVTLNTTQSGSTFTMKDPVETNLSCQDAANNTTFSGPDNSWGNGNATSKETGCADALFASQEETRMLSDWVGRNAPDGAGGAWPLRVGLNDENAYYDGTQVQIGHNTANGWIGSMDVVGHEQGHGIDDHTPGGISGGNTQEFVADTWGAATEWHANESAANDAPDFTVGEKVNLVGTGPIRYMYNPSLAGDDNCYSSSIPNEEVHAAAGPGNHWFYLLAEGTSPTNGQPTSPTCNSSSVTGVGIQNAIKIMYNAMLMKTTSSSYLKYRTWTLTAAKNLDASCGLFNATKNAWNAVSVPAQTGDPTCGSTGTLTVTNPGNKTGTVGTAISPFTIAVSGGTAPYTFSATGLPPGIVISTSGTVSGTPTAGGTYSVSVSVHDASSPQKTGSTAFTFTISGGGGTCGNLIVNGGFESGSSPWSASAGVLGNTSGQTAHGGSQYAWLDGYGTTHTDTLSQAITIPSGCNLTLNYYLHIDSAETTTTTQYDKLTLTANSTTVATFSNLNKASGYTLRTANLSAFAGQTVTLKWTGTEDSSLQTSFVIDDVSTS